MLYNTRQSVQSLGLKPNAKHPWQGHAKLRLLDRLERQRGRELLHASQALLNCCLRGIVEFLLRHVEAVKDLLNFVTDRISSFVVCGLDFMALLRPQKSQNPFGDEI